MAWSRHQSRGRASSFGLAGPAVYRPLPQAGQEGRVLRGLPLLRALIHRSAWKVNSPKFRSKILHNTGPMRALRHVPDIGMHKRRPYMLWWCIKMRGRE